MHLQERLESYTTINCSIIFNRVVVTSMVFFEAHKGNVKSIYQRNVKLTLGVNAIYRAMVNVIYAEIEVNRN